jgi:hypothetical protein
MADTTFNSGTGTFWLVYGTSLMPFFATGANYSSTGNSFEGQHTSEFYATIGKYWQHVEECSC